MISNSTHTQPHKVIVGMSGGVDSSVAALLLQEQGYQVEGLFMKNWEEDDGSEYCTAIDDLNDAQAICDNLNIKLHTANFAAEYWDNVFSYFLNEYKAGRTPNPDILCNQEIKFKAFLDYALTLGADFIATGHYARCLKKQGQTFLAKGLDGNKDQSYFLHRVAQKALEKTLFPLGNLDKTEVRNLAERQQFINSKKKDSTGICFIGERRFREFLQRYLPAQPGKIRTDKGQLIGEHCGLMYYTIGQRQGLGIGGLKEGSEAPWYVAKKDLSNNVLIVVQGNQHPSLFSQSLVFSDIFSINSSLPIKAGTYQGKIRYRQKDQLCQIKPINKNQYRAEFEQPQRAITPGQFLVLYRDDICLGGGIIEQA